MNQLKKSNKAKKDSPNHQKLEEESKDEESLQSVPTVPTAAQIEVVQAIPMPQGFYQGNQYVVPVTKEQLDQILAQSKRL